MEQNKELDALFGINTSQSNPELDKMFGIAGTIDKPLDEGVNLPSLSGKIEYANVWGVSDFLNKNKPDGVEEATLKSVDISKPGSNKPEYRNEVFVKKSGKWYKTGIRSAGGIDDKIDYDFFSKKGFIGEMAQEALPIASSASGTAAGALAGAPLGPVGVAVGAATGGILGSWFGDSVRRGIGASQGVYKIPDGIDDWDLAINDITVAAYGELIGAGAGAALSGVVSPAVKAAKETFLNGVVKVGNFFKKKAVVAKEGVTPTEAERLIGKSINFADSQGLYSTKKIYESIDELNAEKQVLDDALTPQKKEIDESLKKQTLRTSQEIRRKQMSFVSKKNEAKRSLVKSFEDKEKTIAQSYEDMARATKEEFEQKISKLEEGSELYKQQSITESVSAKQQAEKEIYEDTGMTYSAFGTNEQIIKEDLSKVSVSGTSKIDGLDTVRSTPIDIKGYEVRGVTPIEGLLNMLQDYNIFVRPTQKLTGTQKSILKTGLSKELNNDEKLVLLKAIDLVSGGKGQSFRNKLLSDMKIDVDKLFANKSQREVYEKTKLSPEGLPVDSTLEDYYNFGKTLNSLFTYEQGKRVIKKEYSGLQKFIEGEGGSGGMKRFVDEIITKVSERNPELAGRAGAELAKFRSDYKKTMDALGKLNDLVMSRDAEKLSKVLTGDTEDAIMSKAVIDDIKNMFNKTKDSAVVRYIDLVEQRSKKLLDINNQIKEVALQGKKEAEQIAAAKRFNLSELNSIKESQVSQFNINASKQIAEKKMMLAKVEQRINLKAKATADAQKELLSKKQRIIDENIKDLKRLVGHEVLDESSLIKSRSLIRAAFDLAGNLTIYGRKALSAQNNSREMFEAAIDRARVDLIANPTLDNHLFYYNAISSFEDAFRVTRGLEMSKFRGTINALIKAGAKNQARQLLKERIDKMIDRVDRSDEQVNNGVINGQGN